MKLKDLNPRWLGSPVSGDDRVVGLGFTCPHCGIQRLNFYFVPLPGEKAWKKTGDTFETITVDPSLDFRSSGHWHGQIIRGELFTTPGSPPPLKR